MITHVEKRHTQGKDFLVVVWDNESGSIHQEIFEVTKVKEEDFFDVTANEVLTKGKLAIDILSQLKSLTPSKS